MTNTVFSTVDRFASKFKLMDSLINTVTARLLPQQEAKADGCQQAPTTLGGVVEIIVGLPAIYSG